MNIVTHGLGSRPRHVFTLQLGWERAHESSQDIADTLATIQEVNRSHSRFPPGAEFSTRRFMS